MIICIHVTYIVYYIHGFTQILSEACRLRLNINYWLIKNNIRITPSNLRENERAWHQVTEIIHATQPGWAWNPVKTKIAVQAGVYKCLLPFICFSYGVYLSVLVTCYAYRGNIVYNIWIREDSWINRQDRVLRIEPEPEPFKVHSSRWGVIPIFDSW